jgi:hypothetical protein
MATNDSYSIWVCCGGEWRVLFDSQSKLALRLESLRILPEMLARYNVLFDIEQIIPHDDCQKYTGTCGTVNRQSKYQGRN